MCQGITQKGNKCKKKEEPYCFLHKPVQPIKGLIIESTNVQKKLERRLKRGPSKSDGPGHIYVYYLSDDNDYYYYKIGRTERSVEERLKEWKGAICKKYWKVQHQKFAERLIHIVLDDCRVYRYILQDDICSIWKTDGEPVTERDALLKECNKLSACNKMIEWFRMPWEDLEKIILKIVLFY